VDYESSLLWPSAGYTYPETGGFAVGFQDGAIKTNNCEKHFLGVEVNDRCSKFDKVGETNERVMAAFSSLSEFACLGRNKQLAKTITNTLPSSISCLIEISPLPMCESQNRYWNQLT